LQALSEEVGSQRTLLVCCGAFRLGAEAIAARFPNLTVKKIPKAVLQKCEWNHDDYSLNIANLPMAAPAADTPAPTTVRQPSLFESAPAGDEERR
jgi:adenine-specific DNA-methyltransferase